MWNRMLRQTYGWACLSIFVAIALAACETPAPGIAAPTVSKEIGDISSLAKDTSETVSLSDAFKGEKLTFSPPRSSNLNVAIPTITADNRSIIIRAIGPGTATITVTATNSGGRVSQSFKVTVPQPTTLPPPPPPPPPEETPADLNIKLGESAEYTSSAGQRLESTDKSSVSVEQRTKTVWVITALKKGIHTITIFSGTERAGYIVVEVPNSRPSRIHEYDHDTDDDTPKISVPTPVKDGIVIASTTDRRFTATVGNGLKSFFTDPDIDDRETLRYRIANKPPSWILINAKDGFVHPDDGPLLFEVLDKQLTEDRTFMVTLHAVDGSGGESTRSLVIEIVAPEGAAPLVSNYEVRQAPNGDLNRKGTLRVGPRMVSTWHTLKFLRAAVDHAGFRFASLKAASLVKAGDLYLGTDDNDKVEDITTVADTFEDGETVNVFLKDDPETEVIDGTTAGMDDYYLLKSSGDVEARWNTGTGGAALNGDPKIEFRLTGTGTGRITIEYHVWKYTGSVPITDGTKGNVADKAVESISLDIVICNSPPDLLSDCPGAPPVE